MCTLRNRADSGSYVEEKMDNSTIVNTEMVCPNPDCQKQVVKENKKQTDRYAALRLKSEQRATLRKAALHEKEKNNCIVYTWTS